MNISQRIQNIMNSKGVTRYKLAKEFGVHQTTIKNWFDKESFTIETLTKIAKILDVSIQSFFESEIPLETTANFLKYATENNVELVRKPTFDERVMNAFKQVNDNGREKIAEYAEDIASNPKYKI